MMSKSQQFYDINQFPAEEGLVLFPISMGRISNAQRAETYFGYLEHFLSKIKKTDGIGVVIVYSDYLYMHTDSGTPQESRAKYTELMIAHKNSFLRMLKKRTDLIPKAYTFLTWGQLLLNSKNFTRYSSEFKALHQKDALLQRCVVADSAGKEVTEGQQNFILEESLLFHLITKGVFSLPNDYIQHREKWILNCYPGKPLATEAYLYQKNPFNLDNPKNKYQNSFYDLEEKKLYDLLKVDISPLLGEASLHEKASSYN
jgi:hypothetical protein